MHFCDTKVNIKLFLSLGYADLNCTTLYLFNKAPKTNLNSYFTVEVAVIML